ncbi:MAG: 6-carboxytetrahydropterin synthase [Thermoguttaceae bacterium]|nr:6-carboxytetrahydropterin synthase [Thermoguttaceae bacterium]
MPAPEFSILLDGEDLAFTARHFITLRLPEKGLVVEPIHEHTFRVAVRIRGALNDVGLLVDFHAAHRLLAEILDGFRGRCFLGENQKGVRITTDTSCIRIKFTAVSLETGEETEEDLAFSHGDIVPIKWGNATAELIALHIASRYYEKLKSAGLIPADTQVPLLTLTLEEYPGMKAVVTL